MSKITANDLQEAVNLTAALVINDGKYEKWEKLFYDQLKKATGLPWKNAGWSEVNMPRGKDAGPIHRLSFKASSSILLWIDFNETVTGYSFRHAGIVPAPRAYTNFIREAQVSNGKDLIKGIVQILQEAGTIETPGAKSFAVVFHSLMTDSSEPTPVPSGMKRKVIKLPSGAPMLVGAVVLKGLAFSNIKSKVDAIWKQADSIFDGAGRDFRNLREYMSVDVIDMETDQLLNLKTGEPIERLESEGFGFGSYPVTVEQLRKWKLI